MRRPSTAALVSVALAVAAVVAAALVTPTPGDPDHLTLCGAPFGSACPLRTISGVPCPSCGMTRSWVYAVRGELAMALRYNAAGVLLFAGIVANGVAHVSGFAGWLAGWARREPRRSNRITLAAGLCFLGLWAVGWGLRLAGVYPLP